MNKWQRDVKLVRDERYVKNDTWEGIWERHVKKVCEKDMWKRYARKICETGIHEVWYTASWSNTSRIVDPVLNIFLEMSKKTCTGQAGASPNAQQLVCPSISSWDFFPHGNFTCVGCSVFHSNQDILEPGGTFSLDTVYSVHNFRVCKKMCKSMNGTDPIHSCVGTWSTAAVGPSATPFWFEIIQFHHSRPTLCILFTAGTEDPPGIQYMHGRYPNHSSSHHNSSQLIVALEYCTHGFFLETLGFLTGPEKYQIIGYHDFIRIPKRRKPIGTPTQDRRWYQNGQSRLFLHHRYRPRHHDATRQQHQIPPDPQVFYFTNQSRTNVRLHEWLPPRRPLHWTMHHE